MSRGHRRDACATWGFGGITKQHGHRARSKQCVVRGASNLVRCHAGRDGLRGSPQCGINRSPRDGDGSDVAGGGDGEHGAANAS
jgi:hypothetical protein